MGPEPCKGEIGPESWRTPYPNLETKDEETIKLLRGNTILIEALMGMCLQYLSIHGNLDLWDHSFMSAGEHALSVLDDCGMVDHHGNTATPLWDVLEARQLKLGLRK